MVPLEEQISLPAVLSDVRKSPHPRRAISKANNIPPTDFLTVKATPCPASSLSIKPGGLDGAYVDDDLLDEDEQIDIGAGEPDR